jgi:hypothetical protein
VRERAACLEGKESIQVPRDRGNRARGRGIGLALYERYGDNLKTVPQHILLGFVEPPYEVVPYSEPCRSVRAVFGLNPSGIPNQVSIENKGKCYQPWLQTLPNAVDAGHAFPS